MSARQRVPMRSATVAVIFALAALSLPSAALGASSPLVRDSGYLALGDSVTFGYEEPAVVPPPDYGDAASFLGYPELIARMLHVRMTNAACPGETSSSLINPKALSNGCENTLGKPGGYRTRYPLHVHYSGSQLAFAVSYLKSHPKVRLVSLMIGANDFFVCQETTADGCTSASEQKATATKVRQNVARILTALRKSAHYHGQLAIVNYYSLNYASSTLNAFSRVLNAAQNAGAKGFSAVIAPGFDVLRAGSRIFGGNTCAAGLLTRLGSSPTPTCGIHPSYSGQALLAQALISVTRLDGDLSAGSPPFTG